MTMRPSRPSVERRKRPVAPAEGGGDRADMQRELKARIDAGVYRVDPMLVAEAMIGRMRGEGASAVLVPPQPLDPGAIRVEKADAGPVLDQA